MAQNYQNFRPTGGFNSNGGSFGSTTASGGTNYNGTGNNSGQPYQKKSGCQSGKMEDGRPWVSGWHGVGRDYVSFIANRGKDKGKTSNSRWESWIANFHNNNGQEWTVNCLYDTEKKRLKFPSLGWVANPSAAHGGYTGKGGTSSQIKNNNNR
jgi:hypothetical protein